MDEADQAATSRMRWLLAAAIVAVVLIGAVSYQYSDALGERWQSLMTASPGHAQGHIRY
jgi:hypothetical protein